MVQTSGFALVKCTTDIGWCAVGIVAPWDQRDARNAGVLPLFLHCRVKNAAMQNAPKNSSAIRAEIECSAIEISIRRKNHLTAR